MSEPLPFDALSAHTLEHPALSRSGETVLRDDQIGGPGDPADRRLILDSATLRALLSMAENSLSGRVVIHHAGVRRRHLRTSGGHVYEVLVLIGDQPVPESSGLFK